MVIKKILLLLLLCLFICHLAVSSATSTKSTSNCSCLENDDLDSNCICSSKGIDSIPGKIRKGIKNLDLSNNKITTVNIIPETETLEKIDLSNNLITAIDYDAFDNLDYLKVLILSHNQIDKIGDDLFEWNPLELRVIHLDHNKLEFIQHFLFYDLDQLFEIDLSYNNITFIHPHAFAQLKTLVTLQISNNKLHTLDPRWFGSMSSDYLDTVRLANNLWSCDCAMAKRIQSFNKQEWVKQKFDDIVCKRGEHAGENVFTVDLKLMQKRCEPPEILGISQNAAVTEGQSLRLQCLVNGTKFPVASVVWKAPNGDTYNYHNADKYDGIAAHPDGELTISNFRKADAGSYFCVANNDAGSTQAVTNITFIEKSATNTNTGEASIDVDLNPDSKESSTDHGECPKNCKCLSLSTDCALGKHTAIPASIPKKTLGLNFESNQLKTVEKGKLDFPDMIELRFDENIIGQVEDHAFDNVPKLKTLSLRGNQLKTLPPRIFVNLKNLNKLVLDNNQLEELDPDVFEGLEKLAWLYIRDNKLGEIKENTFKPLQVVDFIHMENNQLHGLSVEVVKELTERPPGPEKTPKKIKRFFVNGNDFYCDCRLQDLHDYLNNTKDEDLEFLFGDGLICQYPSALFGKSLVDLKSEDLTCPSLYNVTTDVNHSSQMTGLWFGGMILGIVLCIAAIFFIRRRSGRSCFRKRTNYASLTAQDTDYTSLVGGSTTGGGSEAFV